MCRNIRTLHNFDPAASDDEIRASALQYVRKVSGSTRPSQANREIFDRAVDEIALATASLLDDLVTSAPAKDRELEAVKHRQPAAQRYGTEPSPTQAPRRGPGAATVPARATAVASQHQH